MIKQIVRKLLQPFPFVAAVASRIYRLRTDYWRPVPERLDVILRKRLDRMHGQMTLVQVGANDGISGDPFYSMICEGRFRAVLVEPVPDVFEKLLKTHGNRPGVTCVNAAISSSGGTLPFFVVDNSDGVFPAYFDQLGSFNRVVIERQSRDFPHVLSRIRQISVPCLSFSLLCEDEKLARVDVLHIDAEGYDLQILDSIDLDGVHNRLLVFEHSHLDHAAYCNCLKRLKALGYAIRDCGTDTAAWR
jgi:FkbM family methyltransferase